MNLFNTGKQENHEQCNTNEVLENIALNDKNWFGTGGKARFFCTPNDVYSFIQNLEFAKTNHLEIFILGDGANVLISDYGFNGIVIKPNMKEVVQSPINSEYTAVRAETGVLLDDLILLSNWYR